MAVGSMTGEPVPDEVLMAYSGHKQVTMLHRYLDWGAKAEFGHRKQRAAAANLQMPPPRQQQRQQQQQQQPPQQANGQPRGPPNQQRA
jgi:hypothetical protein